MTHDRRCQVFIVSYSIFKDITKTGNGEWGMGNGEWGMGNAPVITWFFFSVSSPTIQHTSSQKRGPFTE